MISKWTAQRLVIATAVSMAWAVANADECELRQVEGKTDEYAVYGPNGVYKGYVALEIDGSWFAWVAGEGARNESFLTRERAAELVCKAKE